MVEIDNVKKVVVHFDNIRDHLRAYIKQAHYIICATSWVTDWDILDDLATKRGVQLIIQNDTMATRQVCYLAPSFHMDDKLTVCVHKEQI